MTGTEVAYRYRWTIIGVLWTAYIVVFMHRLSMGPLAPFLKEEMNLTSTQLGALMSASSFGYMLSIIPAGWGVDRIGVRRLLLIGEVVGGVFMLGMFLAPSYGVALALMSISGFGCGCLMPSTTKGVMVWFPLKERATVMGIKQTGVNVGGAVTAAVLPLVALAWGWRFGFLFLGILAIAIGILSFSLYREPPVPSAANRVPSIATGDVAPPAMSKSLSDLFKARDIWLVAFAGLAIGAAEFALVAHLVLYLKEVLLFPVATAGVILAVTQAGGILGKPGGGLLSDRLLGSRRKVFMLQSGIASVVCILIALWGVSLSWALFPVLFILGVAATGWGGIHLTLTAELAGTEMAGRATGVVAAVNIVGFILGPILFGYVVDASGYQWAWLSLAICALLCVAALYFVREERRKL